MHDRSPSTTELTDTERLNRLRLIRSDNVGPRGIMAQTPQGWRRLWLTAYDEQHIPKVWGWVRAQLRPKFQIQNFAKNGLD